MYQSTSVYFETYNQYVTPHGETHKKSLNPNPRYSQFSTNGVLYRPLGFFLLIIVPGCLFHNFLQTKLLKSI